MIDSQVLGKRSTRLPSWDTPPPPRSRRYTGPKAFGYPPVRHSRTDDLEQEVRRLARRVEQLERAYVWHDDDGMRR
jgi:hypothetical protein